MTDNMGLVPMSAELTMFYHDFESSLAFAAQQERDRIIALLKGYFKPDEAKSIYPANYEQYLDLIALIKGEQK